jgi:aryl-alcohol dehydrogenase-like predicted oxidoreductase
MKNPPEGFSAARRRTLALLAAAGAWVGATAYGRAAAPADMPTRPIPASGERIPVIGLGTWRTFDLPRDAARRKAVREVLRRFVELGGTVIDTSPYYGRAETVIGELTAELDVGSRLFHATKIWASGREAGIAQMKESFRRMRVARMDLVQVHNLRDLRVHQRTLNEWKSAGRVRYIGITHGHESAHGELARLVRDGEFDFVQVNYSVGERGAEERVLPAAADSGTAVLINRPFMEGELFQRVRGKPLPAWCADFDCASWAQFFLKFILSHPAVTCVIPATDDPRHLADNMAAGRGRLPDAATRRKMAVYLAAL